MTKPILILLIIITPIFVYSQDCSCEDNYLWVKKTFEENDAGFDYAIGQKGIQAYEKHNEVILKKVRSIGNSLECTKTLYEWLTFFRSGHIGIRRISDEGIKTNNSKISDNDIIKKFENWDRVDIDLTEFKKYLLKTKSDYEGIWESPPYKIGIKKQGEAYIGFIIEADGIFWREGQVKLRIFRNDDEITATYYMQDHSAQEFKNVEVIGNNYLQMGWITLKRIYPEMEIDKNIANYYKLMKAEKPFIQKLTDNTLILRIPSFSYSEKKIIDSTLKVNTNLISSTENLIIDLRNNPGGDDASYMGILPYIYTNSIRTVGAELLSTPLNNKRMKDFIANPDYSDEVKKWAKEGLVKLNKNLGKFVNLDSTIVSITKMDSVYKYPKNVGIIINENNGSTTEQFLLAAKQSKKVKLFGTTTMGVLDISNIYFVNSPCNEFQLGYSLSRSMRIPEMAIDDKGIQPDYYIDKSIPKYKWVEFVTNALNEK
ncbi:MAG: S41 family peptidase [bacterium]